MGFAPSHFFLLLVLTWLCVNAEGILGMSAERISTTQVQKHPGFLK